MNLKEIYDAVDGAAPFSLSREYCEKYGAYDNSGILLDCGRDVTSALFSLDCSLRAIGEAKRAGAELLVTHHPAIYTPIKELSSGNPVTECARAGISIISAHLNLDCAEDGIDDSLAKALGADRTAVRMHALSKGGYGSVFNIKSVPLGEFVKRAETVLRTERVTVYGGGAAEKIASFCGAGTDEECVSFALKEGADTFVSSDPKHHLIAELIERGKNVVILTHYAAENYGFGKFCGKIKKKCPLVRIEHFTDERLM